MSAAFGYGLLTQVAIALTEDERRAVVEQVVTQARLARLREPIGGGVYEARFDGARVTGSWLGPDTVAALAPLRRAGWCAEASELFSVIPEDTNVLLPGVRGSLELRLTLPGNQLLRRLMARGLEERAAALRPAIAAQRAELPNETPRNRARSESSLRTMEYGLVCVERCLTEGLALSASWGP